MQAVKQEYKNSIKMLENVQKFHLKGCKRYNKSCSLNDSKVFKKWRKKCKTVYTKKWTVKIVTVNFQPWILILVQVMFFIKFLDRQTDQQPEF